VDPRDDVLKRRLALVVQRRSPGVFVGEGAKPKLIGQRERRIARDDEFIGCPKPLALARLVGRRANELEPKSVSRSAATMPGTRISLASPS
jgi:hypothetical protein